MPEPEQKRDRWAEPVGFSPVTAKQKITEDEAREQLALMMLDAHEQGDTELLGDLQEIAENEEGFADWVASLNAE